MATLVVRMPEFEVRYRYSSHAHVERDFDTWRLAGAECMILRSTY